MKLLLLMLLCFVFVLEGCGFRLRGSGGDLSGFPMTYLQGGIAPTGLLAELRRIVPEERLTDGAQGAEVVFTLINEGFDRRALSVAPGLQEYELLYTINFEVKDKAGEELTPPQTVNVRRDYQFDPTQVLGSESEEATIRQSIVMDAAQQILRRLQALDK